MREVKSLIKYAVYPVMIASLLYVRPGLAQTGNGWYLDLGLGAATSGQMGVTTGGLDDWVSAGAAAHSSIRCDVTINPTRFQTEPGACSDSPGSWGPMNESFDGGERAFRQGWRWVTGQAASGSRASTSITVSCMTARPFPPQPITTPARIPGFQAVQDAVDSVFTSNLFANLYFDFGTDSNVTPWLGIGAGAGDVAFGYRTLWHRTNDLTHITVFSTEGLTGEELARARALNQRVAGTITTDRARLSDTLLAYQVIGGFDYRLSDPVSIGLKLRWVGYDEFEDESEYDYLRDHASVAGNPPVPVTYYVKTGDIRFWGVSLVVKYRF